MDFREKTIRTKSIYKGKIIDVNVYDVSLPNGGESKREVAHHPGAVAVIAMTESGKIVLVRQFRKALEKEIYEIPAGKLEQGEAPIETAYRELEEETGYRAKELTEITSFYTSPGFSDEIIYLFEAKQLSKGVAQGDEDEFVEMVEVTLEEAQQMIKTKAIHDAKTVFAIYYLLQQKEQE
nr:NUDIX hydrolase [Aliibacillus thermotolerans]